MPPTASAPATTRTRKRFRIEYSMIRSIMFDPSVMDEGFTPLAPSPLGGEGVGFVFPLTPTPLPPGARGEEPRSPEGHFPRASALALAFSFSTVARVLSGFSPASSSHPSQH